MSANTAIDVTAQSFVTVWDKKTGQVVYQVDSDTVTYSAARTASWALAYKMYDNDAQKQFLLDYVDAAIETGDIQALNLSRTTFGVQVGTADYLEAVSYPAGYGVSYTSADPSIATVNGYGRVTGIFTDNKFLFASRGESAMKLEMYNSALDENGAGDVVYIIPYKYKEKTPYFYDYDQEDNGEFFPEDGMLPGFWN